MAREEADREDLLREATALTVRAEFRIPANAEPIVLGFRPSQAVSLFIGPQWVWHFDPHGHVRRGFDDGKLIKADRGRLVAMRRERYPDRVELVPIAEPPAQQQLWLDRIAVDLDNILQAWECGKLQFVGAIPDERVFEQELERWFQRLPLPLRVAWSLTRSVNE